jgi:nitroimidazol reductase NimA-like FMN-containing flavoprotein (pyridoxamine 5'-phosphate oxidase superfamily)
MTILNKPTIRTLKGEECHALLGRNWIGRIAYAFHDRVDLEPIHYVYEAPWIFGRTSEGAKVLTLAHNQWCAFETDEVHGLFDWESVVVKGQFTTHGPASNSGWDYDHAVSCLQKLVPAAFTDEDPTPHRDIVFAIHASEISGRASVSWHADGTGPG